MRNLFKQSGLQSLDVTLGFPLRTSLTTLLFLDPEARGEMGLSYPRYAFWHCTHKQQLTITQIEALCEHFVEIMQKMQKECIKAIEVREEPTDSFNEHVDTWMKKSVWMTECRSWYKMGTVGGKAWLWPGGVRISEMPTCSTLTSSKDTLIPQNHQTATLREL